MKFPTVFLGSAASLLSFLLFFLQPFSTAAQSSAPAAPSKPVEVVRESGYPELHVDGRPFFVHSATFFYYRLPRDLWQSSLERHRALGINTIDLLIPWNWHEVRDSEWDFDGHTNPRRDLRGLLQLLAEKGFKVIARPGPIIAGDWRHAGYPEWLLARPEYAMDATSLRQGKAPLAELSERDPAAAAKSWMANATHMERVRTWLAKVAAELAPFGANRKLAIRVRNDKGNFESKSIPGPVILVQAGDVLPANAPPGGPELARYNSTLREILAGAGLDALYIAHPVVADAKPEMPAVGAWFARPQAAPPQGIPAELTARDAAEIEAAVGNVMGQGLLPPILLGFQAGWAAPPDDVRPPEAHPANTLLASRLAIAHGARGLNYFPLQDTLTPPGYGLRGANLHYRWDAALDAAGNEQPRARFVARNGYLLEVWGEELAASHARADFGVVLPRSAFGRQAAQRISRVAYLAGLTAEPVDVETQPAADLQRHALILLPAPAAPLSDAAQRKLVDYVRSGGTLAVAGPRATGEILPELWKDQPAESTTAEPRRWNFGQGRVAEIADPFSWVVAEEDFSQTRMRGEAVGATQALHRLLNFAGVRPVVRRNALGEATGELAITELVSNKGTGPGGAHRAARGFLMVTNLSPDEAGEENIEVLSPASSARGADESLSLPLHVPARESLLLPMNVPLCATAKPEDRCRDEVVAAGAELLDIRRDGRTLELTFYTPGRALVLLRLAHPPRRVQMEEFRPEAEWVVEKSELHISIPRGAWPNFERVVKVSLPYTPFLPEPPKERRHGRDDYDYAVSDAVRLPIEDDVSLPTEPPLIVLDENRKGRVLMQGINFDELGRTLDFRVDGATRGSDGVALGGFETRQVVVDLKATPGMNGDGMEEGLLPGEVEAKSGRDARKTGLRFVSIPKDGTAAYQFDFDRDGAREWVLENADLRVIVSPQSGGRAIAIVDKDSQKNLVTSLGGMADSAGGDVTATYSAQWNKEQKNPSLLLRSADGGVEKTGRLLEDAVVVDYAIVAGAGEPFATSTSVPASRGERGTKFCWRAAEADGAETCEPFAVAGAVALPPAVRRMEVREPGRPVLEVEWEAGQMRVEMKRFSALLRLEFPAAAEKNQLRYKVKRQE